MKRTINLPDQLMTEVETLATRERRSLGDLMAELVRAGIDSRRDHVAQAPPQANAEEWLDEWLKIGAETLRDAPDGPTATEILEADRNRLERNE